MPTETVASSQRMIRELQGMLDKALNQRDAADEALKREKELVAMLSANRDALVKQAGEDEKRIRELEASVKCLTAENTELERQVNECSELEDEKERLEEEVQDLETEKEELEEQVEELEAKLKEREAKVKEMVAENVELEAENKRLAKKEEKTAIGAEVDARFTEDLREQLKASRGITDEALRVAQKNQLLYHAEVERCHAHEKRIEELEERCYEAGAQLQAKEFCEEHEQPMWKDGLKCGGCEELEERLCAEVKRIGCSLSIKERLEKRIEELEKEREEMLEALADKDRRIVKAVGRVVELEKGEGRGGEVARLTNLVKALCAENMRLHDQFGS